MKKILLIFFTVIYNYTVYSQLNDSILNRINNQLDKYSALHPAPGLYLHIDKSIYVPNEHIWFTSYFVNPVTEVASYHTLYVILVDKLTKKIVANDRFVITDGIGKGQILMQDSLSAGEYTLIAYTNASLDNMNTPLFQQSISLRSFYKPQLTMTVRQPVEVAPLHVNMKFYPEGGNLVDGHLSKVAFEIFTSPGKALATTGTILENGKPVAKFLSNQNGLGTFKIKPKAGDRYTIVLDEENPHVLHSDFPAIEFSGYTIALEKGTVNAITVNIQPPSPNSECIVLVHNYKQEFYVARVSIKGLSGLLVIPVAGLPAGVAAITIFNDRGIPVAERAVLIKNDKQVKISMNTDSSIYNKRGRVHVKIKITDENDQPLNASFSFACVLNNRIDTARFIDITRYQIFDQYLAEPGVLPAPGYFDNETNCELSLLTRFWTRYNWNKINDTLTAKKLAGVHGYVLHHNRTLRQPVELALLGKNEIELIVTDSSGKFQLPSYKLNGPADSKFLLSVNGVKVQGDYVMVLKNDLEAFNTSLSNKNYNSRLIETDELPAEEKKRNKNILRTVVITSKKKKFGFDGRYYHSAKCDDWVCMYNILNCSNHPSGTKPVNGNIYIYRDGIGTEEHTVIYMGCVASPESNQYIKQLKATYFAKEFYVSDYAKFNPVEEETYTTVYWSHQVITDKKGEALISFYTNDLAGRFICVLEGLTEKGPVSNKIKFEVH